MDDWKNLYWFAESQLLLRHSDELLYLFLILLLFLKGYVGLCDIFLYCLYNCCVYDTHNTYTYITAMYVLIHSCKCSGFAFLVGETFAETVVGNY